MERLYDMGMPPQKVKENHERIARELLENLLQGTGAKPTRAQEQAAMILAPLILAREAIANFG